MLPYCFYWFRKSNGILPYGERVLAEDCLCNVLFVYGLKEPSLFGGAAGYGDCLSAQSSDLVVELLCFFLHFSFVCGALSLYLGNLFGGSGFGEFFGEEAVYCIAIGDIFNLAVQPHTAHIFEQNHFHTILLCGKPHSCGVFLRIRSCFKLLRRALNLDVRLETAVGY